MRLRIGTCLAGALAVACAAHAIPSIALIAEEQMRIDLVNSSVVANGGAWDVDLYMANDNDNPDGVLDSTFRRWWHVQIEDLNPAGETLNVTISHSGYSDTITPVWSIDGGATYSRISDTSDAFDFAIAVPAGVTSIRLAKWYPYTIADNAAYRASINADSRVTQTDIGDSVQGRDIWMHTITDGTVPSAGKKRVWIHTAVHCAENTAYFTAEGMIDWLLSGDARAEAMLDGIVFNVVLMANPDGVALGNYRTNANSVNLENEWSSPYNSTVPEIVAMRTQIEGFMGTSGSPGANPIELLLNLHSTHNVSRPFHFVHAANWPTNGVTASVNALEQQWVRHFRSCSQFLNVQADQTSTLGSRPFVESMMHDRYSIQPAWNDVMAITMEGTYQFGPTTGSINTPDDYRNMGKGMGIAIGYHFGILPIAGETDTLDGIVINEVLADPTGTTSFDTDGDGTPADGDEFVELANVSGAAVDISGWQLWSDGNNLWYTFPGATGSNTTVLPAGAKALVVVDVQAGGSFPPMDAGSIAFDANSASSILSDTGDNVVLVKKPTNDYIQLRYGTDGPDRAASYSSFPSDGILAGIIENWGTPAEGLSLSRMPDGDMIVDADPRDNTSQNLPATPGRDNDTTLAVTMDGFAVH